MIILARLLILNDIKEVIYLIVQTTSTMSMEGHNAGESTLTMVAGMTLKGSSI